MKKRHINVPIEPTTYDQLKMFCLRHKKTLRQIFDDIILYGMFGYDENETGKKSDDWREIQEKWREIK